MKKSTKNKCKLNLLLTKAVLNDKVFHVRCLIKRGADPFYKDTHDRTLLHQIRSERMIRLLIKLGLDINAKDRDGRTAMEYAVNYDRRDENFRYSQYIIKEFLKHKPDIKEIDKSNRPLLYSAITARCNLSNIKDLINYGADVNAKTTDGNTALHAVLEKQDYDYIDLTKVLLAGGANIFSINDIRVTPLTLAAVYFPSVEAIKLFMIFGKKINVKFRRGYNALQWVVLYSVCKPKDMKKILEHDFYRHRINNQTNFRRNSLLHLVCSDTKGNIKLAKLVIKFGADIDAKDLKLCTPLHAAVCNPDCDPKLIEFLLDSGADINAKNFKGNTPLHFALKKGKIKCGIIKTLIFRGANIRVENNNCTTVFYGALKNPDLSEKVFLELLKSIYENDIDECLGGCILQQNPLYLCIQLGKIKYAKILLKYMTLKSFKAHRVLDSLVQVLSFELHKNSIDIREQLMHLFLECWEELKMMKGDQISENVSLLEIISLDISKLMLFVKKKNKHHLMAAAISRLNSKDYSIYNDLFMCLKKTNLLQTLEEMQIYCKKEIESRKIILDQLSVYHLIKYFSKEDMINIIIAFSDNLSALKVPSTKSPKVVGVKCNAVNTTTFFKDVETFITFALEFNSLGKLDP